MVTITWAGVWGGIQSAGKFVKDTTVKYVGGKTVTAVVAGAAVLGGQYAYNRGSALFIKEMEFQKVNNDDLYDVVVRMRGPFRDAIYLQQTQKEGDKVVGTGKFEPIWVRSEEERESLYEKVNRMTPEAESNKK